MTKDTSVISKIPKIMARKLNCPTPLAKPASATKRIAGKHA